MTSAHPGPRIADLVIEGAIATLDGPTGLGWVDAIAIGGGRVLATGRAADVVPLVDAGTRTWRLPPHLAVVPGITDAHLHLGMAARAATNLDLGGVEGREAVLDTIRATHRSLPGDAWLEGHGWSLDTFGGWPTAADLATVAPGRLVALWSHDHHARWVSTPVLELLSARDLLPADQALIRRDERGAPTGLLHEAAAALVEPLLPAWDSARRIAALTGYATTLAALGITGVHDPGDLGDDDDLDDGPFLVRSLAAAHRLPLRVTASVRERQLDAAIAAGWRTGEGSGLGDDRYRAGWLKLFTDGSLGSRSAALLAPYEPDDPRGRPVGGPAGLATMTHDQLRRLGDRATRAGIALQVHAIGDAAVRLALDVLERLPRVPAALHRLEHVQLIDPVDVARFGAATIAASVQPCHLATDADAMRDAWGDRVAATFPLASLDATGALLPLGTDAPVEPPDPWRNLAVAVTRRDAAWPPAHPSVSPTEALTVDRALRAACIDPARTAGRTDLGSLTAGCIADLVVVPVAGLLDPGDRGQHLAATRLLATLIDGEVAWQDPGFDP
ncbi:MAG: amidohydrolase [Chloroflexi bacterium]|nr:amidohydrolase [Chloroflexota bacterium]